VRAGSAGSAHADVDLSSRRVRLAHWMVDGVRNGRQLAELLGARFERRLKEAGGGALLPQLRRTFPGGSASGILDGLALRAAAPAIDNPAYRSALGELADAFDALADAVTAEAVYQVVRGNPSRALVEVDDLARGETPPDLQITRSPAIGTRVTFRVAAVVPAGRAAPGWPVARTPRADADPLLDAWCGHVLGPAATTVVTVDGSDGSAVAVGLDRLAVGALDVMAAAAGSELAQRVIAQARVQRPTLAGGAVRDDLAWKDLRRLCGRMARLIARAHPLTGDALAMPDAPSATNDEDGDGDLAARVSAARTRLQALSAALGRAAAPTVVREAAGFGIVVPGLVLDAAPASVDRQALAAAVRGRLAAAAARTEPRDVLRALVGEGVLGLVADGWRASARR
jgi:hypothetical protein